jgi:hypothetical protein
MSVEISIGINKEGLLVHIMDASRGLDCDCLCTECGQQLVAKKGDVNQHHFSHYNPVDSEGCHGGVETALHRYAKQVIESAGYLQLPTLIKSLPYPNNHYKIEIPARKAVFEKIVVEEVMTFGRRRVDLVGYEQSGRTLIEVFVSHRVKGEKFRQVRNADEFMVEIEIKREAMFPNEAANTESLDSLILDSTSNKHWIYHPDAEAEVKKLELKLKLELRRQQEEAEVQRSILEAARLEEKSEKNTEIIANNTSSKLLKEPGLHFPSRSKNSKEEYVTKVHNFILKGYESDSKRAYITGRLRLDGSICELDDEVSKSLGLSFWV